MRTDDVDAERVFQFHGAAGVVDMAMRDPDLRDFELVVADRSEDAVDIAAGIDHHALPGHGVEQDGAILLEWGDRHDDGVELSHLRLRFFRRQ